MTDFLRIHPDNPQPRYVKRVTETLSQCGVIAYPTDSSYAVGCSLGNKQAAERIRRIRQLNKDHNFTLVCRDLSEIAQYSKVDNINYRLLKAQTPGPYTFILPATGEVPKRLQNARRKTIGLRIPDNLITQALLEELNGPLMSSTLIMPDDEFPMMDPHQIQLQLENHVDLIIDGGYSGHLPTTVIDLTDDHPVVLREGKGEVDWLVRH